MAAKEPMSDAPDPVIEAYRGQPLEPYLPKDMEVVAELELIRDLKNG